MPDNSILSRLDGLKIKYEEIGQQMTDPEVSPTSGNSSR